MTILRAALIALIAGTAAQAQETPDLPGYDRFDMQVAHRARPLDASIWYPALNQTYVTRVGGGPLFKPEIAFMGPAIAEGTHPLILLSHGSGGNMDAIAWLSRGLAARGAMVLAVNHPGSTSGDSSPRRSLQLDQRARDLTAALDLLLEDPSFGARVDRDRISVVGFSLGGATALGLAGMRFDGAAQDLRCADWAEAGDCAFFHKGGVRFGDAPGYGAETRDLRVGAAVAIDPGFGHSATEASLAAMALPVHLINLGEAHRLRAADAGPDGSDLAARLPQSSYDVIAPANHFTFLAECTPAGPAMLVEEGEDPICTDPEGADRAEVHGRILASVAGALGL